jgi:hypothetical protein
VAEPDAELGFNEVEFFDESFRLKPGDQYEWEMMEFASAAKGGADSDLLSGAATTLDFLRAVIHDDDWERFRATAKKNRAQVARDLMPVVVAAFVQPTDRPTSRPSDSSDGPKTTKRNSAAGSSSKVIRRLEKAGRPDLALMVAMADEDRSARSA